MKQVFLQGLTAVIYSCPLLFALRFVVKTERILGSPVLTSFLEGSDRIECQG